MAQFQNSVYIFLCLEVNARPTDRAKPSKGARAGACANPAAFVQGVDGDVVDETAAREVQGDGQPDAQRRQAQGHNRLVRYIHEDGLRLEDEGIRRGVRDTEKDDAVGEMLDLRGVDGLQNLREGGRDRGKGSTFRNRIASRRRPVSR